MLSIEIFTRNRVVHHILENLSQRILSNILNFRSNTSFQLFDGGWRSGKNPYFLNGPIGRNPTGLRLSFV